MKTIFDRRSYLESLRIGDRVWLRSLNRTKGLSPKLQSHWDGPFEILAVLNDQLVKIKKRGKEIVVHRSKLKKHPEDSEEM